MLAAQPEKRKRRRGAKARALLEENKSTNAPKKPIIKEEKAKSDHSGVKSLREKVEEALGKKKQDETNDQNSSGKKKRKRKAPLPGEEGYLSKTQMRNARKRRAKQRKREVLENNEGSQKKKNQDNKSKDPSQRYIKDPRSAPLLKKAKNYFKGLKTPFKIHLQQVTGWRTVCKLPVRRATDDNSCVIGLFKQGSHEIVRVPDCPAHHESINKMIRYLEAEIDSHGIEPFNEFEGTGILRYVCINVERSTGKVQLTLVWNSKPYAKDDESAEKLLLEKFTNHLTENAAEIGLHSLWVHFNNQWKHADNIFDYGSKDSSEILWKHLYGPEHIQETLNLSDCKTPEDVKLCFPPNVFRQANIDAFSNIVVAIRKYIKTYNKKRNSKKLPPCVELYGGVGTIGLNMYDLFSNFISSDENPYNKKCFEISSSSLPNKSERSYIPKNATDVIEQENILSKDCEVVIVDPPRKGLDPVVTQAFIDSTKRADGPKLLVYVSCGFDAFTRDCNALVESGQWALKKAEGHILFPGSDHLETLAFFESTSN